ncbi:MULTISPECIES: iron-containing alcohol dehydrogenase [Pseudomonas]|uniref:iron-containing alcohol dehydrogenase n=1 Tax=Pseudomonas TaxID=286 RepID=UPI0018A88C96|nr:iron-containing alcohol dehydrogenase [Pseudomonas guariconensis]MBF8720135.1 iron-containing alcohol dehydrogenase [Pseudomonas guariconensis]MBF8739774.1 iron-containing alcohol dehydrogenase [Pseudomonas guariconensis]MBF8749082.1 iron-containing alcohol dehydrogenase [Pseudomonas guariconensis]
MQPFSFATAGQILSEAGAVRRLASLCRERGARRVLIVTDPGIARLGMLDDLLPGFTAAQVGVAIFTEVAADPGQACVLAAVKRARHIGADLIVGFGGGSSMDVAKLVALLAHPESRQPLEALYGVDQAKGQRLPLIQIPTTAGTGSEVTPIAIVTTAGNVKMGVVSPLLLPDLALLDADCTLGLPAAVTAATGIDAMVHAIEAYTSKLKRNPLSSLLAREALRLLASNLDQAVYNGGNLQARQAMLLGACLAGQAFANAPVAAVHALAYPLGGHFHIPHGLSNALVLPHVLRFNLPVAAADYAELAPALLGERLRAGDRHCQSEQFVAELAELGPRCGLPGRLRDVAVPRHSLGQLAEDAMRQQRLLVNNPREVTAADALTIYEAAY